MIRIEFQSMSIDSLQFHVGDEQSFKKLKIVDLKLKLKASDPRLKCHFENTRLRYNDRILENKKSLAFYGIQANALISCEKFYEPSIWSYFTRDFKLSKALTQDAITGDIDANVTRAIMSCGHNVRFFVLFLNSNCI